MIRHAKIEDSTAIAALIEPYIDDFALNQPGRDKLSLQAVEALILNSLVHYYVYTQDQRILAVIAYKHTSDTSSHLIHFFTMQNMRQQGIGRKLWQFIEAKQQGILLMTVNSSCAAQQVYEKLGFQNISAVIETNGLRFIQMRKVFAISCLQENFIQ